MSSKNNLATLIELAEDARNQAAQLLASEQANTQLAAQQLRTLEHYRDEYSQQLQLVMDKGLDLSSLQNYQAFLSSLDRAIAQAHQALEKQQEKVSHCQQHWQKEERRLSSYNTLYQRRQQQEKARSEKSERRENDEISANFAHRSRQNQATGDHS